MGTVGGQEEELEDADGPELKAEAHAGLSSQAAEPQTDSQGEEVTNDELTNHELSRLLTIELSNSSHIIQSESPLVKISPEIQQKVDIFQVEKRKAETSPELSKKEKKKVKNYEKK